MSVEDLDKESFDIFHREAIRSGRMSKDDLKLSNQDFSVGVPVPEYTVHSNDIMMMFKINEPVNEPVKMVFAVITKNPNLSKEKIAERIGMSRATVTRALAKLIENGTIQRVGSDKAGHWEIVKK